MKTNRWPIVYLAFAISAVIFLTRAEAFAHCDTVDGPVVKAAQKALETKNADFVLIWVQKQDEPEVTQAFQRTLVVRRLNRDARELADKYFFETVVRLHRAGEGEPFTGLKPSGSKIEPIISALDRAIETGSVGPLLIKLPGEVRGDIQDRFNRIMALKKYNINNVEAGRTYVKSYVTFIHHVEHLYEESERASQHAG